MAAAAIATLTAIGAANAASVIGEVMTTSSQVNSGPLQSRSDTAVDPGVEIQFLGNAGDFSWMAPGDSIDFRPYTNPAAPNAIEIRFGATHSFAASDVLTLTFALPSSFDYGVAAITIADNMGRVEASVSDNAMVVNFFDLWTVSEGDFGGRLVIIFNAEPPPEGDLDSDGDVDLNDLATLLGDFGCNAGVDNCPGDIDGDGITALNDLTIVLANFGAL